MPRSATELDRDFDDMREVTEACFDFYTRTFDEPYPFDSYDQVMGPGHNWGAMETAGCVTFRDEYLPRNEPDAGELVDRATVIAHEMAHMWFGDLVTMKWWQDTWLNESFADFMGYHVAHEAGVLGSWPDFSLNRKPTGYAADGRRSTHPIAEDAEHLVDVDTAFNNFDMITYAKGASVLHQLVIWLGWDTFVKGTNVYLTRHRFGNAELADYLEALDSVTDRDVRGWAEAYLRTTGFDTIRVTRDGDVPVLEREGSRPHRFSVVGLDGSGAGAGRMVDLDDAAAGAAGARRPGRAPQRPRTRRTPRSSSTTCPGRPRSTDCRGCPTRCCGRSRGPTPRRASAPARPRSATTSRSRSATSPPRPIRSSSTASCAGCARQVLPQWTSPESHPEAERVVADACAAALEAGDADRALSAMRGVARTTADADLLRRWLDSGEARAGLEVDRDTRWLAVRRLVVLGAAGEELVGRRGVRRPLVERSPVVARRARQPARPCRQGRGLGADHRPAVSNRDFEALVTGLWTAGQDDLVAPYVARYLEDAPTVAERGQAFAQEVAFAAPRMPMALDRLQQLRDDIEAASEQTDHTVLRRGWRDTVDDYDIALRVRAAG